MCKAIEIILGSAVLTAIITEIVSWGKFYLERKKQNKYQDAKNNLPILLDILEDLEILEQAYIFCGTFCPVLEHRCPKFSNADGDGINTMSYAQRGHQFQLIGYKIIRNCRRIIFLTPKKHLPVVVKTCTEIVNFLCQKKSPDSKQHLDTMITNLISHLDPENKGYHKDAIDEFSKKLRGLHDKLNDNIKDELPELSGK